jgi:hypothetical protein
MGKYSFDDLIPRTDTAKLIGKVRQHVRLSILVAIFLIAAILLFGFPQPSANYVAGPPIQNPRPAAPS